MLQDLLDIVDRELVGFLNPGPFLGEYIEQAGADSEQESQKK